MISYGTGKGSASDSGETIIPRDVTVGLFFKIHSLHRQHSLARVNFHSLETHLHSNPLILLILSLSSAIVSLLVSTGEDVSGKFYIPGTKGIYFTPNGNKVMTYRFQIGICTS